MKVRSHTAAAAYTLIEVIIYAAMGCVLSLVAYSALRSTAVLSVKNTNLVRSHDDLRSAYDRLARYLLSANNVPTLVTSTGTTVAYGPNISAAGISYDRMLGGPYILSPYPAAGNIPATQTSLTLIYSSNVLATTPTPQAGDVLIIPNAGGNVRVTVASANTPGTSGGKTTVTVLLTGQIGQTIVWAANAPVSGKLVRPEAFVVVGAQLRYYPKFQPLPDMSDSSNYRLLTDQISTQAGEQTPFSITDFDGDKILTSTLQVRERPNSSWMTGEEDNSYNTYFQLHVNLPSRLRPRTL